MDPFDLSVDIDFNDDEDYDGDKTKKETNEKNQKDTDNDNNPNKDKDKEKEKGKDEDKDAKSNDNEVEGFGDDEYKSENQDAYLPLQGGLAGLIQNLSGVKQKNRYIIKMSLFQDDMLKLSTDLYNFFRVQWVQILVVLSVRNEFPTLAINFSILYRIY